MQAGYLISPGGVAEPFTDSLLRELTKVELVDPWRIGGRAVGVAGSSLLAGALALHFGDTALVCTSPLRYSRSKRGTSIAARSGDCMLSLGYRINIASVGDVDLVLPSGSCRLTRTAKDMRSRDLIGREPPPFASAGAL